MERLKVWLNQQIAKILGDLQEQEPVEDLSPARAGCRIFFMVSLLLGFLLLLVYTYIDAPDARVVQIHRLTSGDRNDVFPSCFLYDRNSTDCKKWAKFPVGIPVSCPCTNTSFPWRDIVKFYVLHENSTDWNMSFKAAETRPYIYVPDDSIRLGNENIVEENGTGTGTLTALDFCVLSHLWPVALDYNTSSRTVLHLDVEDVRTNRLLTRNCIWMASSLFPAPLITDKFIPSKYYEDRTRSTQFLNTPSLLNKKELNTLLAKLARESVFSKRLVLGMFLPPEVDTEYFRRFYNALAHLLNGLLDREEMDLNQSYIYGAQELSDTLYSNQDYDKNATVWYLEDAFGPIFLQPQIDWEAYHKTCNPKYCEVIKPMGEAQKLYWAFGIVGGVATIALAVVTTLLWPCTAMFLLWISERKTAAMVMFLLWISKRNAAATGNPERPRGPLLEDCSL